MRASVAIFFIILFSVISFHSGYSVKEREVEKAYHTFSHGQWGKDFMICMDGVNGNDMGRFQIGRKLYPIMTLEAYDSFVRSMTWPTKIDKYILQSKIDNDFKI